MREPKIALVLSGGSALGFSHVGVIEELEKAGSKKAHYDLPRSLPDAARGAARSAKPAMLSCGRRFMPLRFFSHAQSGR